MADLPQESRTNLTATTEQAEAVEQRRQLWNSFCLRFGVGTDSVPLFQVDDQLAVATREVGSTKRRKILCRSAAMDALVRQEVHTLNEDYGSHTFAYDGLIYMMHLLDEDQQVVPLYIGKAETIGKGGGNLSANIANLSRDTSKFARWGDNYAYHIGDLSCVVLPGHAQPQTVKYRSWASALFTEVPSFQPKLKRPVLFWAKAWRNDDIGIWEEFGPVRLTFLEYLLIGVASAVFPNSLLNREGQNRQ